MGVQAAELSHAMPVLFHVKAGRLFISSCSIRHLVSLRMRARISGPFRTVLAAARSRAAQRYGCATKLSEGTSVLRRITGTPARSMSKVALPNSATFKAGARRNWSSRGVSNARKDARKKWR